MLLTLDELLEKTAALHDHLCPRQVLGVRMGMLAAELLELDLPQTGKRLLTFVETDGCFADGIAVATGCTVGHRTLRVVDYGKSAAVFVDTLTERAYRISSHPDSRTNAYRNKPDAKSRWDAQLEAYQVMPDDQLLVAQAVVLTTPVAEIVSKPGIRVQCDECGEEIINEREIIRDGRILCRSCAGDSYYHVESALAPEVVALQGL